MNILVYGNGTLSVAQQEQKICSSIANLGHQVYLICNPNKKLFDVGKVPKHKNLHILEEEESRYDPYLVQEIKVSIDACLGMDQSVAPFVAAYKEQHKDVYCTCMFLDYPVHVVDDQGSVNYNFNYSQRFYYWLSCALTLDDIIFNNTVAVDRFKQKFKRDSKLVWYCITEDNFINLYDSRRKDYIVGCNRLIPYKSTHYTVDALARTDLKYAHIAVSGNLKDQFLKSCQESLPGRYVLYEKCPEEKKMAIIADAKIMVYPQTTEWVGGLGIIEAMSVKTPGICFDYPVLKELYGDAVLYARKRSVASLREKIKELNSNEELYADLQEKGYKRFKQYFTKDKMARNLITALRN